MSYTYQNFASLPVNLNRQAYGALDISQVFTSLDDLKYYVSKGQYTTNVSTYWYESADKKVVPYPYAGQYIALVNNDTRKVTAYILEENAEGAEFAFSYKEVGITPLGDDKTVVVDATGKISLYGIGADHAEGTFVPRLQNGKLIWETPSTITVEGLDTTVKAVQKDIEELKAADGTLEGRVDDLDETVGEHTTKLGELEAADTALGGRIDGHDTRLTNLETTVNGTGEGETRTPGLVDKVADHTSRIQTVEAQLTNVYTKDETNQQIATEIGKQAHFSAQVVTDKALMTDATVLYLYQPEGATGTDVYEQYIVINGVATCIGETSVDLTDYAKTGDVESKISAAKTAVEAGYGEADRQLGLRIDGVTESINKLGDTYATITEMDKKANQTDLDETNETVEDHESRLNELEAIEHHEHTNKGVIDGITAEKVAQWDAAEVNVVKSVKSGELAVSEAGELSIVAITQGQVSGLTEKLNQIDAGLGGKVDKVEGKELISTEDLKKLTNLTASGTLDASKIDNLGAWISENRETVSGLLRAEQESKLDGIAAGAQVNVIEGVRVGGVPVALQDKIADIPLATNSAAGVVIGAEAVNAVMINASNQMEVHSLNVNKLVQDDDTVLILNGGNA